VRPMTESLPRIGTHHFIDGIHAGDCWCHLGRDDGAKRGIRCAAKSELGDWCSRDAGHRGAHESRDPKGRGLVGWWNEEYLR
jgi:hypothetical protein